MQANIIGENKIPLDAARWPDIILQMRRTFFNNKFDDYFAFLSGCYMGEKEIIERKGFYLQLAPMLSRQLRMTPHLYKAYPYIDYIAEDILDCGDTELMKAGADLSAVCKAAKEELELSEPETKSSVQAKPPETENADSFIAGFSGDIKHLFINELDAKWILSGPLDKTLAMICELMYLERAEAESIAALWFNNNADYSKLIDWFLDDFCFLLREIAEEKWLAIYCRLAIAYGCGSPNYYSYQAEAYFKLREYSKVIDAVGELEKKYQIKPYLEHLKCFSLWQLDKVSQCMDILRRRLENDPNDILAALLAGDIFLSRSAFENALKSFVYAYHLESASIDVLYSLARAFHACYFTGPLDLCLKKADSIQAGASRLFKFGAELYIKCSKPGARVRIDGHDAGECPLCFKGIESTKHIIEWINAGGGHKRIEADLKDGYICKYNYIADKNKIEIEESRDGRITLCRNSETIELDELLKDYIVESLDSLPKPAIEDFIGRAALEYFQ